MSMTVMPDYYAGPNFNKKIQILFRSAGFDPLFVFSALQRPMIENQWSINLPDIPAEKWKQPNFRLVIHAQDFVNWHKNTLCKELFWLEKQFTHEQQRKIIFLHWDHGLTNTYEGHIECVEFASHSYELVHQLQDRWEEWKAVHNKDIKYNWICLNGRPKFHRNRLFQILQNQPTGFVTHGLHNPAPMSPYFKNYGWNNVNNFIDLMPLYQQSKTSIVGETIYADHPGIISEKTLLAVAAKHPFMCIGHIGMHSEIAERGFENFHELFDLSYDTVEQELRIDAAMEYNLPNLLNPDWDIDHAQDKAERNFDFLMSDYTKTIEQRAQRQLAELMKKSY